MQHNNHKSMLHAICNEKENEYDKILHDYIIIRVDYDPSSATVTQSFVEELLKVQEPIKISSVYSIPSSNVLFFVTKKKNVSISLINMIVYITKFFGMHLKDSRISLKVCTFQTEKEVFVYLGYQCRENVRKTLSRLYPSIYDDEKPEIEIVSENVDLWNSTSLSEKCGEFMKLVKHDNVIKLDRVSSKMETASMKNVIDFIFN